VLSPQSASRERRTSKLTSQTAYETIRNFLERQGSASILGKRAAFDRRYAEEATLQDVVQDIDVVENRISDAMASRTSLQDLISNMFTSNKEIRFTDESIEVTTLSGEKIGLASLSSGEKHLLRMLVQALLIGQSSLMIDEPEISLHVDWQKILIRSMRTLNSKTQLILATHSPEIMVDVADEKIFRI
jgi:predicted ATP-dependent endonuclease of OLD family